MNNWIEISVGIFTVVYTSVNIAQGICSFVEMRRKELDNVIADAVDFIWITHVKNKKKLDQWNDESKNETTEICKDYINSRLSFGCCVSTIRLERLINDRVNYKKQHKYIKEKGLKL